MILVEGGLLLESIALMIIIGILTALFNKNKAVKKGFSKAKPFVSNYGNVQDMYKKLKEATTTKYSDFSQKEPTLLEQVNVEYTEKMAQIQEETSVMKQDQLVQKPEEVQKIKNESTTINQIDNNHLVNAIIWSEILGEPRAKKPYSSRRK
jgi:CRISPR/Cas system CMR-associated protein Cmr5 small subunit